MNPYLLAVFGALAAWWLLTGLILFLNHLPRHTHRWSLAAATLLLLGSLAVLPALKHDTSAAGATQAFILALLVWSWLEISYLMGFITGPQKGACPEDATGRARFRLALGTSLHHEIAVIVLGLLVLVLNSGGDNRVASLTFCTLWTMRWSAKLNLFLGVRNYNMHWLPEHLQYLDSYTRRRHMNALFPLSVLGGGAAALGCFVQAGAGAGTYTTVGYTLVGTLLALAVLEHLFLMLPLRDALLWQWASPADGRPLRGSAGEKALKSPQN